MFDFFKKKEKGIEIGSPVKGKTVAISNVSDPTFGEEILGKGVAIIPAEGRIYRYGRNRTPPRTGDFIIIRLQIKIYKGEKGKERIGTAGHKRMRM